RGAPPTARARRKEIRRYVGLRLETTRTRSTSAADRFVRTHERQRSLRPPLPPPPPSCACRAPAQGPRHSAGQGNAPADAAGASAITLAAAFTSPRLRGEV